MRLTREILILDVNQRSDQPGSKIMSISRHLKSGEESTRRPPCVVGKKILEALAFIYNSVPVCMLTTFFVSI